jgi:hypothetical protein
MPETESISPDRLLRLKAIAKLGGRCAGNTCRWHNNDGTVGCNDERALQFHHKDGGGSAARKQGKDSLRQIYCQVLRGSLRFELLCANCHEIEKKVQKRAQGARQHVRPARVRRSLQIEGQPVKRVKVNPELEFLRAEQSFLAAKNRK